MVELKDYQPHFLQDTYAFHLMVELKVATIYA